MLKTGYIYDSLGKKRCYVAEFIIDGYIYYISADKHDWTLYKKDGKSLLLCSRIPAEAMKFLKQLPDSPYDYQPYMKELSKS